MDASGISIQDAKKPQVLNPTKTIGISGEMPTDSIVDTLNYYLITIKG